MTASSAAQVEVERHGAVAVVRFANPPDGLIANKGAAQLVEALDGLLADPTVRAIVLTGGQAGVFIRHADVAQIGRAAEALADGRIEPNGFLEGPFPRLGRMLDAAEKPVIAAIDGVCMGGGFEIALACTARIASPAATAIGLPEIRLGIFPGAGGTQRLQRVIGPHRARLFILQGRVVDAAEALEVGLVDEVAPSALARAAELAQTFADRPRAALAAVMALMREGSGALLDAEAVAFAELLRDHAEVRDRLCVFTSGGRRLDQID